MRKLMVNTLLLALSLMPFLSVASAPEKKGKQPPSDTVSSVVIDNSKKIISEAETTPIYYSESIRNVSSDKPAFVNVNIYRLNNIGEGKEDLTKIEQSEDADIYVMPNQVIVPASGVRTVRVYLTEKLRRDQDRYYRIRFSPLSSPAEDDTASKNKKASESSLFIGMGAGQLLMVGRERPAFDTKISVDKKAEGRTELTIMNAGNSFIRLENMKTCFMKKLKKPCSYSSGRHVNAGRVKTLPIGDDVQTIDLELLEGSKTRKVEYNRQASKPLKVS